MLKRGGKLVLAIAGALALAGAAPAETQAGGVPASSGRAPVERYLSLSEMGFPRGLTLTGLTGPATIDFPVATESAIEALRLALPYHAGSAKGAHSLLVELAGQPVLSRILPEGDSSGRLDIEVPASAIRDGKVQLRIVYAASQSNLECADRAADGAFLTIAAEGALIERLDAAKLTTPADIAAAMPRASDIVLPEQPSAEQTAAALLLLAADPQARLAPSVAQAAPGQWLRSVITLAAATDPALQSGVMGGLPAVTIGGGDPVGAARRLGYDWVALEPHPGPRTAIGFGAQDAPNSLTFAELGLDGTYRESAGRQSWSVVLPASRLPFGTRLTGVGLGVVVGADGGRFPPVISATMNGLLLGSALARPDGLTRLQFDIPEGPQGVRNVLTVTVARQAQVGDCQPMRSFSAQLLSTSRFILGRAYRPKEFYQLAPLFRGGVTVVLPNSAPRLVAGTARLMHGLVGLSTPLRVSFARAPDRGPFVWVSPDPPPGSDPAVRFDLGAVQLETRRGTSLFDAAALRTQTVAQLVTSAGQSVLWIRPGKSFGAPVAETEATDLAKGDIALLDGGRMSLAFMNHRDTLVEIAYQDRTTLLGLLSRYRLWLIAGGWLLCSFGFVILLRGMARARRSGK